VTWALVIVRGTSRNKESTTENRRCFPIAVLFLNLKQFY
jgi:hypothetical protein